MTNPADEGVLDIGKSSARGVTRRNFIKLAAVVVGTATITKRWPDLRFPEGPPAAVATEVLPIGYITQVVGDVPKGWLLCDGSDISRWQYPELARTLDAMGYPSASLPDFRLPVPTNNPFRVWHEDVSQQPFLNMRVAIKVE